MTTTTMQEDDDARALRIATEDAREFIKRAKQLLADSDIFPGDHEPDQYDAHVIAVAKLISDQYRARDIEATLHVYVGSALDDIRNAIGDLPDELIKAWRS